MAKKKKLTKAERKEARLRKGKQWLLTYTGSPKKMNKHYRERFHVDAVTAAKDLQELGVNYTQEQLDRIKRAEEQRLRQRRMEREAKERERLKAKMFIPAGTERIRKNMLYSIVGIDYHKNRAVSTKSFENTPLSAVCKKTR